MIEEWKLLMEYKAKSVNYNKGDKIYISNFGNCKANETIINPKIDNNGYCWICCKLLHRIVYELFVNKIPNGYEIDHIDGNKSNNNINNLRLVTHKENCNNPITKERNNGWMNMGMEKIKNQHKYLSSLRKGSKLIIGEDGKKHWKYIDSGY